MATAATKSASRAKAHGAIVADEVSDDTNTDNDNSKSNTTKSNTTKSNTTKSNNKENTTMSTTTVTPPEFQVTTFAPVGRKSGGREKSELRVAIENLNPGEWLNSKVNVKGLDTQVEINRLSGVRSKTEGAKKVHEGAKYSVIVTAQDQSDESGNIIFAEGDIAVGRIA